MNRHIFFLSLLIVGTFVACDSPQNPLAYVKETHGRGKAVVYVEESFKPLFETSISTFESLNPKADITAKYLPKEKSFRRFLTDK